MVGGISISGWTACRRAPEHPAGSWGPCSEPQPRTPGWHLSDAKAAKSPGRNPEASAGCDPSSASPGHGPQNPVWGHPYRGALPAAPSIGGEMLGVANPEAKRDGDGDRAGDGTLELPPSLQTSQAGISWAGSGFYPLCLLSQGSGSRRRAAGKSSIVLAFVYPSLSQGFWHVLVFPGNPSWRQRGRQSTGRVFGRGCSPSLCREEPGWLTTVTNVQLSSSFSIYGPQGCHSREGIWLLFPRKREPR